MTSPQPATPPETMEDDPRVTRFMTSRIVGITSESPLSTALRLMAHAGVRHLPVLDGGRCMGILTEADLARFVAGGSGPFAARVAAPVEELTRPTEPLPIAARRSDAARRMRTERTDAVLVAHRGRLLGLVTATDLVRSLAGGTPARSGQGTPS
jgi:CBS domain-containing protein